MKMSSNDNAKVSDSGYTNTCENSQSQGSSGSSLSRNSNQSESSGYCDGHPSNFGFRNEALPQPISTKKEKEHKKKKSKTSTTISNDSKPAPEGVGQQVNTGTYSLGSNVSNQTLKKSEEVGIVELVDATDSGEHNGDSNSITPKGGLGSQTNPLDYTSPNANEEFYTVVSLHDGLVVQSTASLQTALGYPKDDWLGCPFIDFIHSKDRPTFAEKLADGIVLSFKNRRKGFNKYQTNLFCNLRRYVEPNVIKNEIDGEIKQIRKKQKTTNHTNNSGATLPYVPFHLSLGFKHFRERRRAEKKKIMLLTIIAEPVFSAYKAPEETIISSTFSTRHTASCHFSHVDNDVVKYFGYLPQDMVGRSLFDFYHPEDLPFIKDIYETVVRLDGSSFRSKPYRFAVQNGGYVVLETEWSSYINPWERKLEFVVGHHRVLRGPVNPDVFQPHDEGQCSFLANISEEVFKESQIIQDEIRALLAEKIEISNSMSTYDFVKQSTKLALFMDNLMHEVKKRSAPSKAMMISEERNLPETDNSMVGEISLHHEYCDSKSSSETPPSYNQLNYNEKIERFFNSKPLFRKSGVVELVDATDPGEHNGDSNCMGSKNRIMSQNNRLLNTSPNVNEEFYTVVSLQDGLVLNSTASLQTALGYPKNSWLSRSFLDFIRPQDRATFFDKLACGITLPTDQKEDLNESQMSLFCNLRRFIDIESENEEVDMETEQDSEKRESSNVNVCRDANLSYAPFHLNLGFKTFQENSREKKLKMMLLTVTAEPVFSAYKAPEETIISSTFSTRHTASCHFSHVDNDVVKYFGYLPQDMVGRSLFDFYHPEDLPFIKDIYETVVRLDGSSFRSKPYRFAVQNGGYVVLETEWSSYINPWERKLEFVVGHHRVLRGPVNPDVFQPHDEGQCSFLANISEEVFKESQIIQDEIRALLAEKIEISNSMSTYDFVKQSTKLALFMDNLMHEVKKRSAPSKAMMISEERNLPETDNSMVGEISLHHEYCDSKSTKRLSLANTISMVAEERSFSERDSVMLGEISPHHEYCDSKSSSETPPSYNQLNYNETMERFFNSKPLFTTVYGSDEEKVQLSVPSNDDSKTSPIPATSNPTPPNQDSGGSGSGENLSNDSINQISSGKEDNGNGNSNDPMGIGHSKMPILTETLLNKHNQDMEKLMILKHKERRSNIKNNKLNKDVRIKTGTQEEQPEQKILQAKPRGYKRKNNNIHENQFVKVLKYNDKTTNCNKHNVLPTRRNETKVKKVTVNQTSANINVWPRITFAPSHPVPVQSRYSAFSQMIPVYYMLVTQPKNNGVNENQTTDQFLPPLSEQQESFATSYGHTPVAGVIYPPVIAPTPAPILYAPPMVVQVPTVQKKNVQKPVPMTQKLTELKRPASQATSVKAEPGSTMAMSESSKKLFSPGDRFSSCVSVDGGCSSLAGLQATNNNSQRNSQVDSSIEDSSDSSFYGSFLNTSSGSSCYPEQIRANHLSEKIIARSCKGDAINRRRFSMVTELKANFESQSMRGNPSTAQKFMKKRTVPHFNNKCQKEATPMDPPWQQNIKMTPELIYRYQMSPKSLSEVLKADMQALNSLNQPLLVNEQLDQLYLDLELGGFNTKLILDDSNKSSDSEHICNTENQSNVSSQYRRIQQEMEHSKLAMIYEENAPLPMA